MDSQLSSFIPAIKDRKDAPGLALVASFDSSLTSPTELEELRKRVVALLREQMNATSITVEVG